MKERMNNRGVALAIAVLMAASVTIAAETNATKLPRLVDLGADKCIPCKMMAPILKELKAEYVGRMEVEFIDVWKKPDAAKPYKIKIIPTQIFFDSTGKELFRHEGFLGREDILKKWKELGVDLQTKPKPGNEKEASAKASKPVESK